MVNRQEALMVRRRSCAVSNHEGEERACILLRRAFALLRMRSYIFVRFTQNVQAASLPALARRPAPGNRYDRCPDAQPVDAARRYHRPADPGEADPGGRLGVPPGARGRHDAPPGAE